MSVTDAVALVAAAVGAFIGSGSAFLLEAWRRARAEKDSRYAAIIDAQFSLSMQLRTLVNLRNEYLNPVRDQQDRFMALVPAYGEIADPPVDLGGLSFIACDDETHVLQSVHMAQAGYRTALSALQARNEMMGALYQMAKPARDDFDFETGGETVSVDGRLARRLKGITDGLYEAVDSAIDLEHEAIQHLAKAGKRLLSKRKFLAVEEVAGGPS